jgi:hypothetical protein
MKSIFDYSDLEGDLEVNKEVYSWTHPNGKEAQMLLTTSHNLLEAEDLFMELLGEHTDDARKFQHIFVRRGANALRTVYILLKNHSYDAVDGRIRYLFEVYLLLKGLNEDRENAARIWRDNKEDIHRTGTPNENPFYTYEETDELSDIIDTQKKSFLWAGRDRDSDQDSIGDLHLKLWRQISNRGSHPHTIQSAYLDGKWHSRKEFSLLMLALSLAFGITAQYIRTYEGTPAKYGVLEVLDYILVEIKLIFRLNDVTLPIFLDNETEFW